MKQKREVISTITKEQFIYGMKFITGYIIVCLILSLVQGIIESKKVSITKEVKASNEVIAPKVQTAQILKNSEPQKENKPVIIRYKQKWETEEQAKEKQKYVDYVWKMGQDIDMILTFELESGYNPDAINKNYKKDAKGNIILDKNGNKVVKSTDYGLVQLNSDYHIAFIQSEDFEDPYKQLDYGIKLYKAYKRQGIIGKRFYGYNYRNNIRSRYFINQEAVNITYKLK